MLYEFPVGLSLAETREVISAHNEALGMRAFIEADRGDYVVFNYCVSLPGSFPFPVIDGVTDRAKSILRECRGLKFYADGPIAARPFFKFFNISEKEETQTHAIDWARPHIILKKLDGSMLHPFMRHDGSIDWHTKMGATDVAKPVCDFVRKNPHYETFVRDMHDLGQTPIFEWCSRMQRIVVDYPVDMLILTAVRDNHTGAFASYKAMKAFGCTYGFPVVDALEGDATDIKSLVDQVRAMTGEEGVIVRFDTGHMVKIKADEYVRMHSAKDNITREKDVWEIVLRNAVDDMIPLLPPDDQKAVERFSGDFECRLGQIGSQLEEAVSRARNEFSDRKAFATAYIPSRPEWERPLLFSVYNGMAGIDALRSMLLKHCGTGPRLEQVRHIVGLNWNSYFNQNTE